jgi:hypothetical protein
MHIRQLAILTTTIILLSAVFAGAIQALEQQPEPVHVKMTLENVRDYAPATSELLKNYAVDGGQLFAGENGHWTEIPTPSEVIIGAVTMDSERPGVLYIGAANELTIFKSNDDGQTWIPVPLSDELGGVTDIAVDSQQRIIFVGTDSAGVFRLRDVGSSVVVGGQLLLDEPVRQVVTDSTGQSLVFARTDTALYRADNFGLSWATIGNLHSAPTAVAVANTTPATVYVGTVDRGILVSTDGANFELANEGLGLLPGTRVHVDALAMDAMTPDRLYVATSYLFGEKTVHESSSTVYSTVDSAKSWQPIAYASGSATEVYVTGLIPVSGVEGAVYALTDSSRAPIALFDAPALAMNSAPSELTAWPLPDMAVPQQASLSVAPSNVTSNAGAGQIPLAWLIAAFAIVALGGLVIVDQRSRHSNAWQEGMSLSSLETQTVTIASI